MNSIISSINKISIESYLKDRGIFPKEEKDDKIWFSSPFSSDTTPSFVVYKKQNTFYDFSTGIGGDIISLVSSLYSISAKEAIFSICDGNLLPISKVNFVTKKRDNSKYKNFNYNKFITKDKDDIIKIDKYAKSRNINIGFEYSRILTKDENNKWIKKLAIMFIHRDEDLDVCGAKFRFIEAEGKERFTSRGRLFFYILTDKNDDPKYTDLFIVESETSANSLFSFFKENNINCAVLCMGTVSKKIEELPSEFKNYRNNFIIIDYDDNEELYNVRIKKFLHLGTPFKIKLKNKEDINSLYVSSKEKLRDVFKDFLRI